MALIAAGCGSGSSTGDDDDGASSDVDATAGGTDADVGESAGCVASGDGGEAAAIVEVVERARDEYDLAAALVSVTRGGEEVVTAAVGEPVAGEPATTDMRFGNGAVAISYLGTLLLLLVEDGVVGLDDPISMWLPEAPRGDEVTLRMLAASTSGYVDFVPQEQFQDALYADPTHRFTLVELEEFVFSEPLWYEPGTNWSYSHLNFHLLGKALEEAAGQPLDQLLRERIVEPLGMTETFSVDTSEVPEPVLRTFSSERGSYEETTSWDPAWGVAEGAVMVTNICDLAVSAAGIGSGELLSAESYELFLDPGTIGLGGPTDTCPEPFCRRVNTEETRFGLGTQVRGDWIAQTPQFTGIAGVQAYLPDQDLAIAVANTYGPEADIGVNWSDQIFLELAALLAPDANLPG